MSEAHIPLTLHTPAGPLSLKVETTTDKVPVPSVMKTAAGLSDALSDVTANLAQQRGTPVSCMAGCTACCRHLVPVSPFEALALADAFDALPEDRQQQVQARIDHIRGRLVETGLRDRLDRPPKGPEGRQLVYDYFALHEDCPFLHEGACSVYESRPFACRDLTVSSDPAHCDDPGSGRVRRLPTLMDLGRALRSISASVFPELPLQMPLVDALDWARRHRHLRDTVARGVDLVGALRSALAKQAG
jgi:Fe-S-cluster containining protein